MANQTELANQLNALNAQMTKIMGEVQTLLDAIANGGQVSPEVEAAVAQLSATIQAVDDQNPG